MAAARDQGAVSLATAAAAFVAVGCVIVVGAILADVEPYVLKFSLWAYVGIAAPLLIAAVVGKRTTKKGHRSFRLSPLPYMEGKRVKRRLLWIVNLTYFVSFLLAIGVMVLTGTAILHFAPRIQHVPGRVLWEPLLFIGPPLAGFFLALFVFKVVFVRLGWMTREEARPFPFRMRRHRWPDSWLEPIDEGESTERAEVK